MLSKTLQDGLSDYGIGDKLRTLRLKKKMGLVELGKHTGLSPALLSKIERGVMFPTLPTLLRIALRLRGRARVLLRRRARQATVAVVRKGGRVLDAGDSVYFDATVPHAYRRSGGRSCSAIVVTA